MNQRLKTTVVLLVVFALFIAGIYTPFSLILLSLLAGVAVYEIGTCAQIKNKVLLWLSAAAGALIPVYASPYLAQVRPHIPLAVLLTAYLLVMLLVMLKGYRKTKFEHAAILFTVSLAVPYAFSTVLFLRDVHQAFPESFTKQDGIYLLLLGAICAWATDSGAYLAGRKFGKHKMAPNISPKKTVEGAVGGVVFSTLLNLIALLIFHKVTGETPYPYWAVLLLSVGLSVLSMAGDLSASVIKRNYGVKDYGKIFPGHGGVMDRFDSALFVFPALYAVVQVAEKFH